jgi:AcrR family transcriptional regulator
MAKSGTAGRSVAPAAGSGPARGDTRRTLVDAAVETLKTQGFARSSARAIARTAGCNQALVFYHFGSVNELLLAALDEVSAQRLRRYREAADEVTGPAELVAVAGRIFREDIDSGNVKVLVEMIAGATSEPGLAEQVVARLAPWREFARRTIEAGLGDTPLASVLPLHDVSYAVVALYLGLEMLSHLEGDRTPATTLFDHAATLAGLVQGLTGPPADTRQDTRQKERR